MFSHVSLAYLQYIISIYLYRLTELFIKYFRLRRRIIILRQRFDQVEEYRVIVDHPAGVTWIVPIAWQNLI